MMLSLHDGLQKQQDLRHSRSNNALSGEAERECL
jgi:hypothetical protein